MFVGAVPHVFFPKRKGCRVTMYNDAHQVGSINSSLACTLQIVIMQLL